MQRIDNTAEYTTSGLDERQAAGLLSAVGDSGLSLVEPGPAPDPVASGLKAAMNRCRAMWERSQPQLVLEGWSDMLDAADAGAVRCVEPAAPPVGGLTTGDGVTAEIPLWADPSPLNHNGPDATLTEAARRGRKEATP